MRRTLIVAVAAAVAFVIGAATPAFIIERELHQARTKLLRSRQALARTLDILEQHTAPPVRPDGGMRDIAADGGPTAGHVHIARVIVRDPAGRLHMRSVETPDARTCVVVARMLVARADAAPEFEAVGGGCVDGYRA